MKKFNSDKLRDECGIFGISNHNDASAIIDASLTNVIGSKMGKISAWYDNEWGFSNRMCDIAKYLSKIK